MIVPNSLAATLDAINETLFDDRSLSKTQMEEAAKWIVGRQHKSGKYAGMFAPTELDYEAGVKLFTGEKLKTKLATQNVLTAQAAWALALLDAGVQAALDRANRWLFRQCFSHSCTTGECAHSAVSLMRYLAVARLADSERRLAAHIEVLSRQRDGKGRWKRFPFYYTLLTLAEINLPSAVEELHYAVPACERVLRRSSQDDKFSRRRRAIAQRALARC
jgi:hypothetical protein